MAYETVEVRKLTGGCGAEVLGVLASIYDPAGEHSANPLAWPLQASEADLKGFPPTVISTDELDPLRDEGLAMLRALQGAGVNAIGRTVNGMCHAGEMVVAAAAPALYAASIRDIVGFAASL